MDSKNRSSAPGGDNERKITFNREPSEKLPRKVADLRPMVNVKNQNDNNSNNETEIEVNKIVPSKFQYRTDFNEVALKTLADNIRENGLIQAIAVRKKTDGTYEVICGERRLRAVRDLLGLEKIRVSIHDVNDFQAAIMAYSENLTRKNTSEYENFNWYSMMKNTFDVNQNQLAQSLGITKNRVSQIMSVGKLPKDVISRILPLNLSAWHIQALRRLQKHDSRLMYKLLGELEERAAAKNTMDSHQVIQRCNELINDYGVTRSPIYEFKYDATRRIARIKANQNNYSPEEWIQIIADLNQIKEAAESILITTNGMVGSTVGNE